MKITTVNDLKTVSPDLYQAVLDEGIALERARCLAHLDVARHYDSLQEAVEAIREGEPVIVRPGESFQYTLLHDKYAAIEDERDRLEAASGYR